MVIKLEEKIKEACPMVRIGLIRANVVNMETSDELWGELQSMSDKIRKSYELSWINKRPAIVATRELYKKMGKDPNRYRVASEALCRRVVKGQDLYRINALVDLINLVSMGSGYAIGGFDADKIEGESVALGIGRPGEHFEGIGRGLLNIDGLPVYRDARGPIGSPTSDEERTKITLSTSHIQMQINAFAEEMPLEEIIDWSVGLLAKYVSATNFEIHIF